MATVVVDASVVDVAPEVVGCDSVFEPDSVVCESVWPSVIEVESVLEPTVVEAMTVDSWVSEVDG